MSKLVFIEFRDDDLSDVREVQYSQPFSVKVENYCFYFQDYRDRASIAGKMLNQSLVFFPQTVEHVARAARVFKQREGHLLQVGIGGTGKSSVAELAAYIEYCSFMKPSLTRNYSRLEFREDIKKACVIAGVKGKRVVLFLNDALIAAVSFM